MLTRFGNSDRAEVAERVAKACSVAPDALADWGRVRRLADQALANNGSDKWRLLAKAMTEYRDGRYADAVAWLERVAPRVNGVHWDAQGFAVLALAKHQLSQGSAPGADATRLAEEARTALGHAEVILSQKMPDPNAGRPFGGDFHDWLHARILTNEAKGLLDKSSPK
jgi:hypothetical protein